MNAELNHNDPHMIAMRLLGVLNEISVTANKLNLTGEVKYTYSGCTVSEWDAAFPSLQEACQINGYDMVRHIVEVRKGFNVYLLLE